MSQPLFYFITLHSQMGTFLLKATITLQYFEKKGQVRQCQPTQYVYTDIYVLTNLYTCYMY